ncbi:hypothetical protein GCM10009566_27420 [Streptomyces murinus]
MVLDLGVQEVLVDRRQLGGQLLVEQFDDIGVALHRSGSFHTDVSRTDIGGGVGRMIAPDAKIVQ